MHFACRPLESALIQKVIELTDSSPDFHLRYRPDIDGLRAIAVLAVVASHVQFRFFDGGYVGVDVFFVISGFLIGSILLREVAQTGRIDYWQFYERRVRRIFPALVTMLLAVFAVAWWCFLPKDMDEMARMGAATLLFCANIFLSAQSGGYFGSDAAFNFLTHTWSLGVEEQFYILLPPLLMLLYRSSAREHTQRWIIGLATLSLLVSIPSVWLAPTGTFYLLPTRFWELLAGTVAYQFSFRLALLSMTGRVLLALTGLLAILLPIPIYSAATVFPGLAAVPPVLGTALLLATSGTPVHGLLARRPFVFFGKISYSLYLWHWPLVVYWRLYPTSGMSPRVAKLGILLLSIALAWLSWRFVETAFRSGRLRLQGRGLFVGASGVALVLLTAFGLTVATDGGQFRFSPREQRIGSFSQTGGSMAYFRVGQCFVESPSADAPVDVQACLTPQAGKRNVLLLGSSFVAQLHSALQATFPEVNFMQATAPRCSVTPTAGPQIERGCATLMRYVFDEFLPRHRIDAVLFQVEVGDTTPDVLRAVVADFERRGIHPYVMGPQVEYDTPGPALAIMSIRRPDGFDAVRHRSGASPDDDRAFRDATQSAGGTYLSMFDTLCPQDRCRLLAADDVPMEADRAHLTHAGSLVVAEAWRRKELFVSP